MAIGFVSSNKGIQKTFKDVRLHSQLLSSFTAEWQDLEDHLYSSKKSIEDRFKALESREQRSQPKPLCDNMDGQGLRSFIVAHRKDIHWAEVSKALSAAPDPAKVVLDSMQRFYPTHMKNHLVDRLASISPEVTEDLKDKAKKIADNWRVTVGKNGENAAECYAFLQFLAVYGLGSEFDTDELLDRFVVHAARREQTINLCRVLGLSDKIPDLIRKLIHQGRQKMLLTLHMLLIL
ncbi:truncated FRIGIDA-like protein 1 [Magnolia sinica]|uniref:truncated FRIGIDA-like protein 1 n=1 Tax=Magnolia sinica TaxID=86752 RepID=UPI00265B4749|nr:truncated FRIGIDA-like protein 1 [Magnolia sinica]